MKTLAAKSADAEWCFSQEKTKVSEYWLAAWLLTLLAPDTGDIKGVLTWVKKQRRHMEYLKLWDQWKQYQSEHGLQIKSQVINTCFWLVCKLMFVCSGWYAMAGRVIFRKNRCFKRRIATHPLTHKYFWWGYPTLQTQLWHGTLLQSLNGGPSTYIFAGKSWNSQGKSVCVYSRFAHTPLADQVLRYYPHKKEDIRCKWNSGLGDRYLNTMIKAAPDLLKPMVSKHNKLALCLTNLQAEIVQEIKPAWNCGVEKGDVWSLKSHHIHAGPSSKGKTRCFHHHKLTPPLHRVRQACRFIWRRRNRLRRKRTSQALAG